jgi:sugar lactone lactonase YvrE
LRRYATPERLGAFGFVTGEPFLVGAFESGFALFDPESGLKSPIIRPEGLAAGMRLNDGRVDRQGRFWAGAIVEDSSLGRTGCLYCLQDGVIRTRESGLAISNGICWSPDSAWFYFADSGRRIIWRYAFDAVTGRISEPRVFARTADPACPDGAAVDAQGYVWSAQWGGGCVVRYAPDGRIDRVLEVPASQPTCVAFGGPDLGLLFVTTARVGLSRDALAAQTGAGDVLVYNVQVQGLPENRFKMGGWPTNRISGG